MEHCKINSVVALHCGNKPLPDYNTRQKATDKVLGLSWSQYTTDTNILLVIFWRQFSCQPCNTKWFSFLIRVSLATKWLVRGDARYIPEDSYYTTRGCSLHFTSTKKPSVYMIFLNLIANAKHKIVLGLLHMCNSSLSSPKIEMWHHSFEHIHVTHQILW